MALLFVEPMLLPAAIEKHPTLHTVKCLDITQDEGLNYIPTKDSPDLSKIKCESVAVCLNEGRNYLAPWLSKGISVEVCRALYDASTEHIFPLMHHTVNGIKELHLQKFESIDPFVELNPSLEKVTVHSLYDYDESSDFRLISSLDTSFLRTLLKQTNQYALSSTVLKVYSISFARILLNL
jgi:hypothetical protein